MCNVSLSREYYLLSLSRTLHSVLAQSFWGPKYAKGEGSVCVCERERKRERERRGERERRHLSDVVQAGSAPVFMYESSLGLVSRNGLQPHSGNRF